MIERNTKCDQVLAKMFYKTCVGFDFDNKIPNNPYILQMINTYFGYISGDPSPFEKLFITFLRHMADSLEETIPKDD